MGFGPPPDGRPSFLFLDFNSYFASVEQQERPELRGRPVAVMPTDTEWTCAIAASYEAKAHGVKTGTVIREARRICPGLCTVLARHDLYVAYHHRLVAEIERHIPIDTAHSVDEVSCRLLGPERVPEAARALARAIKRGIADRVGACLTSSIGLAPNRYLAKLATELEKPDGLVLLGMADLPAALFRLAPRDLPGIGARMETRLAAHGVVDIPGLWALSPREMRTIWGGVAGERLWYALRGHDISEPETARRTVGHSHVLAPDRRDPEAARLVGRRLALKAASRLRRLGYRARRLSLALRLERGYGRGGLERRFAATADSFRLLQAYEDAWREMIAPLYGEPHCRIMQVGVTLHALEAEGAAMGDLFDTPDAARRESLCRSIDALNARYGRDAVSLGVTADFGSPYTGVKIAFTRIPDTAEFNE